MEKRDKVIVIGTVMVALVMLYMIKPAPAHAFCYEWGVDLDDRFIDLENKPSHTDEDVLGWLTLQRESVSYEIACSDITMFY